MPLPSHLRIAVRDWPVRRYYLLGTLAASVSSIHFMFVPEQRVVDWAVWFLILIPAAMLIEGILDARLARSNGERLIGETHAAAW